MLPAVLVETIERVRREFFGLARLAYKTNQRPNQARVVFKEELLEFAITGQSGRCSGRLGALQRDFMTGLHI